MSAQRIRYPLHSYISPVLQYLQVIPDIYSSHKGLDVLTIFTIGEWPLISRLHAGSLIELIGPFEVCALSPNHRRIAEIPVKRMDE